MRNFQDTFETRKRSFISAFSIYRTVPLTITLFGIKSEDCSRVVVFPITGFSSTPSKTRYNYTRNLKLGT